jgi:hypothetical protein
MIIETMSMIGTTIWLYIAKYVRCFFLTYVLYWTFIAKLSTSLEQTVNNL